LCQRSATSCGTCVKFRPSFVGGLGYCADDKRREPLSGSEQRSCWTSDASSSADGFFDVQPMVPPVALDHGLHEVPPIRAGSGPLSER
jgi:hypothetical protein